MSNNTIHAYAAMSAGAALEPYQFDAGELQPHQVEVKVEYCGLCHSDISVLNNDWGLQYILWWPDMKSSAPLRNWVLKPKA